VPAIDARGWEPEAILALTGREYETVRYYMQTPVEEGAENVQMVRCSQRGPLVALGGALTGALCTCAEQFMCTPVNVVATLVCGACGVPLAAVAAVAAAAATAAGGGACH
jgi:hypothetical protein